MYVNIIKTYRDVVAVCDSKILGKVFEEGEFQLDVKESFFKGEEVNKEKLIEIIKHMSAEDSTFNIIGEESITCAIEAGIIFEEGVGRIDNVPFALVLG